jgi:hypothetical protein
MQHVRDIVCENNMDGFGYALSDGENLLAEKILNPKEFFSIHKTDVRRMKMDYPFLIPMVGRYGKIKKDAVSLIAHGRTATNSKSVDACHPFVDDDVDPTQAFIHNGIINQLNTGYKLKTTNDSELLANIYWYEGLEGIESVRGYYATMNLFSNGRIHIMKDNLATLHCSYIKEIDTYVIATLKIMIEELCKRMNWKDFVVREVKDLVHFTVNETDVTEYGTIDKWQSAYQMTASEKKAFAEYDYKNDKTMILDATKETVKKFKLRDVKNGHHNDYETFKKFNKVDKDNKVKLIAFGSDNPRNDYV